jgi:uncharacterized membrane protein YidH (DUF202 family)
MNFLFFGGWVCSVFALLIGLALIAVMVAQWRGLNVPKAIDEHVERGLAIGALASILATVALFIVGSIALWKGWFW